MKQKSQKNELFYTKKDEPRNSVRLEKLLAIILVESFSP